MGVAAGLVLLALTVPAHGADPLVVISVTAGGTTHVCNTNCTNCGMGSPECVDVSETDLLLCTPVSTGLPITACDWSVFLAGSSSNIQFDNQIRAVDVAPNGNLTLVVVNDDVVPTVGNLRKQDIAVFNPSDVLKPFVGGGPYDNGTFKLYLNGDLSQQNNVDAKPWDAISIMSSGTCEANIDATSTAPYSCPIVGSLTSGATSGAGLDGVHFENEDLLRCIPDQFNSGTVEGCKFEMFLEADRINGVGNGINSDIEAIDFLSFSSATMSGQMVFKMGSGNPPGFPAHDPGKDLLLYDGTFGAGNCSLTTAHPCAGSEDCPMGESCNTGSCAIGGDPCASDDDCASGTCNVTRAPAGTVTKFFDGVAVGLHTTAQNIEAMAILPEGDGDGIPDGVDNCPNAANPPTVCSGPGPETCTMSGECPMGETCVQLDSDGDGVGDPCDQCNGRPDAGTCDACPGSPCPTGCLGSPTGDCSCGDSIADAPSEQCDLGAQNGVMGSPCSLTCTISGKCKINATTFGGPCTDDDDCPMGQGCCGNNVTEDNEVCDDGNGINNDVCTNLCEANPGGTVIIGCEGLLGPNIVPASIKKTKFKDTTPIGDFDRWKTKGEGIFPTGLSIDPDTENVTITYNNTLSGVLFQSTLAPGNCVPTPCFVQNPPTKLKWKFKDVEADVPGSPSWRKGKFTVKSNKAKFTLDGRNASLFTSAEAGMPPGMRQTIRVGDVCITGVVSCLVKGGGKSLVCNVVP